MLKGSRLAAKNLAPDSRLPITFNILSNLVKQLKFSVLDPDIRAMLKSLFLVAYYAFMRLTELVPKSKSEADKVVQVTDISFDSEKSMIITLRHNKTNDSNLQLILVIHAQFKQQKHIYQNFIMKKVLFFNLNLALHCLIIL